MSYFKFRNLPVENRNRIPGSLHVHVVGGKCFIVSGDERIDLRTDLDLPDNAIIIETTTTRAYGCETRQLEDNLYAVYPVQDRASIAWVVGKGIFSHVWCEETEMQPYFKLKGFITSELKDALAAA